MAKFLAVFVIVAVASSAFGMVFRHKRQSDGNDENLDNRYGWEDQNRLRPRPWQNQNQQFPWQNQNQNGGGQFPWQNPNQNGGGQSPWQNQNQNGGGQLPWLNQNQNQNAGQEQFPWQNQNQNGGQGQNQNQLQRTTTSTQAPNGNGGSSSISQECIRNCPVTPEYNPVCGTDNVTYTNPGRLGCAQACGLNVSLLRSSPCPAASTAAPAS